MASLNGLMSGASVRLTVSDPIFGIIDFGAVVSFHPKEDARVLTKPIMTGSIFLPKFREGYSGRIVAERTNNKFDIYTSVQDERYYNLLDETLCTMTLTKYEFNGAITVATFIETQLVAESLGDYQGQDTVQYDISFKSKFLKITTQ